MAVAVSVAASVRFVLGAGLNSSASLKIAANSTESVGNQSRLLRGHEFETDRRSARRPAAASALVTGS
jgi:hypothetical protein